MHEKLKEIQAEIFMQTILNIDFTNRWKPWMSYVYGAMVGGLLYAILSVYI